MRGLLQYNTPFLVQCAPRKIDNDERRGVLQRRYGNCTELTGGTWYHSVRLCILHRTKQYARLDASVRQQSTRPWQRMSLGRHSSVTPLQEMTSCGTTTSVSGVKKSFKSSFSTSGRYELMMVMTLAGQQKALWPCSTNPRANAEYLEGNK